MNHTLAARHRNSRGLIVFPGAGLQRDLEFKRRHPIDSRMPVVVRPPAPPHRSYSIR
jgi:hypothetical protein